MEIIIIFSLVILNGLFAMSEIAIVSASRNRLRHQAEQGSGSAQKALSLSDNPNRFLSAVQIGISLVGVLAGAFGGATIANDLAEPISTVEPLEPYAEQIAFVAVVLFTTYLSLIFGELVPKRLALTYTEEIAKRVAGPMSTIARLSSPIIAVLSFSTNSILRVLNVPQNPEEDVDDADVIAMVRHGPAFVFAEQMMIEGVLTLDDKPVAALMTPRPEIVYLAADATPEDILRTFSEQPHDYYPVFGAGIDDVQGVIRMREWLLGYVKNEPPPLDDLLHQPLYIPETLDITRALERMYTATVPMALIVGEHGGVDGMLTLGDISNLIIGRDDPADPDIVQREDGSWLLDGRVALDRLARTLEGFRVPGEEAGDYATLSGFVMKRLGEVPTVADTFTFSNWQFEVVDMDGQRIDKVLVSPDDHEAA
ncbi:MAG: hemolysin family protein [Anaerolineales bacterium]